VPAGGTQEVGEGRGSRRMHARSMLSCRREVDGERQGARWRQAGGALDGDRPAAGGGLRIAVALRGERKKMGN
jgi:hypothetical protein